MVLDKDAVRLFVAIAAGLGPISRLLAHVDRAACDDFLEPRVIHSACPLRAADGGLASGGHAYGHLHRIRRTFEFAESGAAATPLTRRARQWRRRLWQKCAQIDALLAASRVADFLVAQQRRQQKHA